MRIPATRESKTAWLLKGKTRLVVAKMLARPMDAVHIARAAYRLIPAIEHVQASRVLRQLASMKLVECLTPRRKTGRIYCLTRGGARAVGRVFGTVRHSPAKGIDWEAYSRILHNSVMMRVLLYLSKSKIKGPQDAVEMRHHLSAERVLSYETFYRSLDYLTSRRLAKYCGVSLLGRHRLYSITGTGERMAEELSRQK